MADRDEHNQIDRRSFLGASLVTSILPARAAAVPAGYKSPAGHDIPFSRAELFSSGSVRSFTGA
ncbi:MAG TPA: hypothetical protein VEU62_10685, partial [Bryobacterales bacterium]|nr:hypothetical protein [Bryobacterales bacterium]